jgi:hypothetical protein
MLMLSIAIHLPTPTGILKDDRNMSLSTRGCKGTYAKVPSKALHIFGLKKFPKLTQNYFVPIQLLPLPHGQILGESLTNQHIPISWTNVEPHIYSVDNSSHLVGGCLRVFFLDLFLLLS